ncbi:phosphotransferase enzyme family-domain-containing protein [Cercophora scortea]|uniref:Phosphotransferase enzyme family-domain-containing protein n=1 Tax=Cercophora scortea TaxID=314031 RepID=A0AAE0IW18_9PEZI|nr:phosphotransferase enzyme family-domain-containing protein [Cercophora scortea]
MEPTEDERSPDFSGMSWVRNMWGLEPRWTIIPDETAIMETVKSAVGLTEPCKIEFLAQGAFNKLYTIASSETEVIARVTLPIDPKWKTLSEVATLDWVRENTSLPVPRVLAYRADRSTPIGFEWIAMEKMPGKPWADVWQTIPFSTKKEIVARIALFCSETFEKQLCGIGNIFPASEGDVSTRADQPETGTPLHAVPVQRIVNTAFITNGFQRNVPRGPFSTAREWIQARLDLAELDCRKRLSLVQPCQNSTTTQDQTGDATETNATETSGGGQHDGLVTGPDVAVSETSGVEGGPERRDEGSGKANQEENDIGAGTKEKDVDEKDVEQNDGDEKEEDEKDKNTEDDDNEDDDNEDSDEAEDPEDLENALLIISKLNNHLNNFFPPNPNPAPEPSIIFHDDLNRHNLLLSSTGVLTAVVDWECVSALPLFTACQYPPFLQGKPNEIEPIKHIYQHDEHGQVDEIYWEHLEYFELTQLRRFFLDEMRRLQPGWVEIFESRTSQRQRDFELAVAACDDPFMLRRILKWLADMEESGVENVPGLEERIDNETL